VNGISGYLAGIRLWAKQRRLDADDLAEQWNERAAIREYLGGATRADAEREAYAEVKRLRTRAEAGANGIR
jgi:hypothetical protein